MDLKILYLQLSFKDLKIQIEIEYKFEGEKNIIIYRIDLSQVRYFTFSNEQNSD